MKLKEFARLINSAVEYAEDMNPEINVILKTNNVERYYDIDEVRQFQIKPDVCIWIGNKKL